jgi:phage terminase large subunit
MGLFDINSAYLPLYHSKKRYFFLSGGRGSLKSHTLHDWALKLTYEIGHGILFTRYTMTSAKDSIIPEFKKAIVRLGVETDFHITEKDIYNKVTGSFIMFRGIKTSSGIQTEKLKSLSGITTWIVEEMEGFQDEKTFELIDDSIRTLEKQNRIVLVMNPTTPQHFIYNKWFKNTSKHILIDGFPVVVSTHPELEHIHTTFLIGVEYLSKDWIRKAKKHRIRAKKGFDIVTKQALTEVEQERAVSFYINNYLGGWRERQEGTIFNNWEIGEFDESLPYIFGQDYGYDDPTTLVKVAIDKKNKLLYVQECFYLSALDDDQIFELNLKHADNKLIIADSAAKTTIQTLRRKTTQERKSINLIPCVKKAGSVLTGIQKIQKYRIIVEKNSINLISELNNYIWLDKKSDTPIDNFNHLIDPLRYALDYLDR